MARAILRYGAADRRKSDATPWRSRLFGSQLAYFDEPAKRKTAITTRRAGKTVVSGALLEDAIEVDPRRIALYITLTAQTSRDNLESEITRANLTDGLKLRYDANQGSPRWWHRDGGCIWLAGCKDKAEADKFRGLPYSRVVIDEAGTHRSAVLQYLISDVLGPALTDNDAQICLSGTPGPIPQGYFYEATAGDKQRWPSVHRWTVRDNPHHRFGAYPELLEAHRLERGLELDNPTWIREYDPGWWALDAKALIYRYHSNKNAWDTGDSLPIGRLRRVLSLDLGYDDECAFVVSESAEGYPWIVLQEAYGRKHLLTSDIAAEIQRIQGRYAKRGGISEIVCDMGGLGKTIGLDLSRDYHLPVTAAEKQDKAGAIKRVQAALAAGHVKIARDALEIVDEWEILPWDEKRQGHAGGFPDHKSDAFLYGFRRHPQHEEWRKDPPIEGSLEWSAAEAARLKAQAVKRAHAARNKRWR